MCVRLSLTGLVSILVSMPAAAQSGPSLRVGAVRYDQADDLASPLRYGAAGPSFEFAWGNLTGGSLKRFELGVAPLQLAPENPPGPVNSIDAVDGGLAFNYLRRVVDGRLGSFYLGGRVDAFASFRRQTFTVNGTEEIFADLITALDVAGGWILRPGDDDLIRQELSVPLFSAAFRTPYFGGKELPGVMIGGPGRLVGISYSLEYSRSVSGSISLGGRYAFDTFHYPDPRSFSVVRHRLETVVRIGGGLR